MKTYEIKKEESGKTNIYYYHGEEVVQVEFFPPGSKIWEGYVEKNAPNWLGLEQDLRFSHDGALFNKAYQLASSKGFSLFLTTLGNGKSGSASENGLSTAFQLLPITYVDGSPVILFEWTSEEKTQINTILENNNFKLQLS